MTSPAFSPGPMLGALSRAGVRYVVIGGIAEVLQGSPIITQDLDICYARDDENLRTLATALRELGAKLRGVREDVPFKLDQRRLKAGDAFTFTTSLGDLDCRGLPAGTNGYDEIVANCRELEIDGVTVFVADLDDLIRMKRAAGRPRDRAMIEDLGALREEIQRREGRRRR